MDEIVDILDATGNVTGKTCLKSEAHQFGYWHPCVHIWFYTQDITLLIQKRVKSKDTFPNFWDVSVAGHIGTGEIPIVAAQREIKEEIGLEIKKHELQYVGNFKSEFLHSNILIDKEFHHVYIAKLKVPIEKLVKQKEEVADLKLISIDALIENNFDKKTANKFVPYPLKYFNMIFDAIKNT